MNQPQPPPFNFEMVKITPRSVASPTYLVCIRWCECILAVVYCRYLVLYSSFSLILTNALMMPQGLKNFNKSARELIQRLQKIDGDNYPEVLIVILLVGSWNIRKASWLPLVEDGSCFCISHWNIFFIVDPVPYVHHQCRIWI